MFCITLNVSNTAICVSSETPETRICKDKQTVIARHEAISELRRAAPWGGVYPIKDCFVPRNDGEYVFYQHNLRTSSPAFTLLKLQR